MPDLDDLVGMDEPDKWLTEPAYSPIISPKGGYGMSPIAMIMPEMKMFTWNKSLILTGYEHGNSAE